MEESAIQQLDDAVKSSKSTQSVAISLLTEMGETIELRDWVTAKEYARRFDLESTNVVTNWIRRGVIPAENVRTFEHFNGLRLIKAVPYKDLVVSA